jgi:phosphatidylglycerol:prolipoprotein diacylglycerol transferase
MISIGVVYEPRLTAADENDSRLTPIFKGASMNPVLLKIGPLQVHWYGLLIVGGAVLAAWLCTVEAKRRGEDPEHAWNLLTWSLIFGIIGARLYHVFSTPTGNFAGWEYYRQNPIEIIAFWNGGFRDWASTAR